MGGTIEAQVTMDKKFEPVIKAILDFSLEEVEGLNELTTEEIIAFINSFSDEFVLGLAMPRQGHPGQYGFIYSKAFGEGMRFAEIAATLLNRFSKAQKDRADWKNYVCKSRWSDYHET
jgi:hypothetical protein